MIRAARASACDPAAPSPRDTKKVVASDGSVAQIRTRRPVSVRWAAVVAGHASADHQHVEVVGPHRSTVLPGPLLGECGVISGRRSATVFLPLRWVSCVSREVVPPGGCSRGRVMTDSAVSRASASWVSWVLE